MLALLRSRHRVDPDRRSVHLAELFVVSGVLKDAERMVADGWVQHALATYLDGRGRPHRAGPDEVRRGVGPYLTGVSLVGALMQSAGATPNGAGPQLLRLALDLSWHALYCGPRVVVRWSDDPIARAARTHQLTEWNDDPERVMRDVLELLDAAGTSAAGHIRRIHAGLAEVPTR